MSQKEVVLAFSGGLDTSYCVAMFREQGWSVVTVLVDTGGLLVEKSEDVRARAESLGAKEHIVVDGRSALYDRFGSWVLKANYLRNGVYPSCVGAERMLHAEEVTKIALDRGASAIAHGSTGAGNDHIRFDTVIHTLAPNIEIITPIRDGNLKREGERDYLLERGFDVPEKTSTYSFNHGLLGTTIGGQETYGSWDYLPEEAWFSKSIDDAPAEGCEITVSFERGLPVALDIPGGTPIKPGDGSPNYAILAALNSLGAEHGIGRSVHTGQTTMGTMARFGFEAAGVLILIAAHSELERLVLTNSQQTVKSTLGTQYGDLLHEARYHDPLMRDLEAFIDSTQGRVTGDVRVVLKKGNVVPVGVRSPFSMLASASKLGSTYGHSSSLWTGQDARSFAYMHSLPGMISAVAGDETN